MAGSQSLFDRLSALVGDVRSLARTFENENSLTEKLGETIREKKESLILKVEESFAVSSEDRHQKTQGNQNSAPRGP